MLIIDRSASTCKGSCPEAGDVLVFLDVGAALGVLSEVVGERMITLSRDSKLLSMSEVCFNEPRTCDGSAASLVSVCGGGKDSGSGDEEMGGGADDAADAEATALQCVVSSSSPALSAASLAIGKIFRAGREDMMAMMLLCLCLHPSQNGT